MSLFKTFTAGVLLSLFLPLPAHSWPLRGAARLDSLLQQLPTHKMDTTGIRLMMDIAWEYRSTDPPEGYKWTQRQLKASRAIGWRQGEAYAYAAMGDYLTDRGEPEAALKALLQAQSLLKSLGETKTSAQVYNPIGVVYLYEHKYQEALKYFTLFLRQARYHKEEQEVELAYTNIAMAYDGMKNYEAAQRYLRAAFYKAEVAGNQESLLTLSGAMANTLLHQKAISSAIGWEAKTIYLAFQSGNEVRQANSWGNMGSYFFQASLYDATPNGNLLLTPNPHVNMIWATTFLEMALQKSKVLGHTRGVKVWERVLGKARLFKEALQRGPVKPADIHLYL